MLTNANNLPVSEAAQPSAVSTFKSGAEVSCASRLPSTGLESETARAAWKSAIGNPRSAGGSCAPVWGKDEYPVIDPAQEGQ